MFSPVGNLPPAVYWRRRILLVGSLVLLLVLLVLTVRAVTGGDGGAVADGTTSPSPSSAATTPASSTAAGSSGTSSSASRSSSGSAVSSAAHGTSGSGSAVPVACVAKDLDVRAVAGKTSYKVGDEPVVQMQVTNVGAKPCVQDLADRQIVLKVYNGESRVWGSHDCEIQPGTDRRTLVAGQAVRVGVTWSGRTSTEGCKGTRQRVGAGTYTLYATLSGKTGRATQFTIG